MKKYNIIWTERNSAIVSAENAKQAKEYVINAEIVADTAELIGTIYAYELKERKTDAKS